MTRPKTRMLLWSTIHKRESFYTKLFWSKQDSAVVWSLYVLSINSCGVLGVIEHYLGLKNIFRSRLFINSVLTKFSTSCPNFNSSILFLFTKFYTVFLIKWKQLKICFFLFIYWFLLVHGILINIPFKVVDSFSN